MVTVVRSCRERKENGEPCRAPALRDEHLCFWHSPTTAKEAAEARRVGGLRRRREGTIVGAYEFEGLESVPQIRRLLSIACVDALGLENSIARVRALTTLAVAAAKLLETGELEERVEALEAAVKLRPGQSESFFNADEDDRSIVFVEQSK